MELSRRKTLGALGVAVVAAALPASAAKAAFPPEITSMGYLPTEEGGIFAIVQCNDPVVSVTARLFDDSHTVELGRFDLTLSEGGIPTSGLWAGPPLTGIPLGNYRVEYEATSSADLTATGTREFFLWLRPVFTATVTPPTIDDTHRVVTVSGRVEGSHPVTHAVAPIAGLRVALTARYWPDALPEQAPRILVTTAPDGGFSGQLTLKAGVEIVAGTFDDPQQTLVSHAATDRIVVPVTVTQTRLALEIGTTELKTGESTTLDGLLEVLRDGEWRPLAGREVLVGFTLDPGSGSTLVDRLVTDAQGRFQLPVRPDSQRYYTAVFNIGDSPDRFFSSSGAQTPVVFVLRPVRFSTNQFIVQPTPDVRDNPANYQMTGVIYTALSPAVIEIQFRPGSSGAWQTIATTRDSHGSSDGGKVFTGRFTLPDSGEIRAFAPQTNSTQAAASQVVSIDLPARIVPQRPPGGGETTPTLPPQRRY